MQHYAANYMLFLKHVGQAAQKIDMRYGLMVELGFTSGDYSGLNLYLIHPVYLGIKKMRVNLLWVYLFAYCDF